MAGDPAQRSRALWDRFSDRYDRQISPIEVALLEDGRRWACSQAHGRTLEVGIGTGRNLPQYPTGVELTGVDISPRMLDIARRRAAELGRRVELCQGDATSLEWPPESFDTVVVTLALCSVPDDGAAVAEMARVLVPGGRLIVLEHVRSHRWFPRLVERALDPLARRLLEDHLLREPEPRIRAAGLRIVHAERRRLGTIARAVAVKPAG
ncbi:class I SAM-dependent methyltransferase [Nocardiopsis tropica]|uniref:Methyltransferase domain-containing protein n=1 Tax=Nocardiopsis tropica TaxID=109330 RepID=A0ABU7KK81_9ACTN|nr:methyltransferase domain-containing protein [Nocardiopsis umidischolae]MEE2049699.1 methyltransferase domain-containing protein [Nocardiopsis umidischolae]